MTYLSTEIIFSSIIALGVILIILGLSQRPQASSRSMRSRRSVDADSRAPVEIIGERLFFEKVDDSDEPGESDPLHAGCEIQHPEEEDTGSAPGNDLPERSTNLSGLERRGERKRVVWHQKRVPAAQNERIRTENDELTALDMWVAERLKSPDLEHR